MGAWLTYGLGTENQDLPGYITINPPPTRQSTSGHSHLGRRRLARGAGGVQFETAGGGVGRYSYSGSAAGGSLTASETSGEPAGAP